MTQSAIELNHWPNIQPNLRVNQGQHAMLGSGLRPMLKPVVNDAQQPKLIFFDILSGYNKQLFSD